jgi:hypothetical protein
VVHAVIAWSRLREETRTAARRLDVWIASFDALVVLAVGVTLLMITVLEGFAGEHAVLINEGWPVLALWLGILLLAVSVSELTGRFLFRWLERAPYVARVREPGIHASAVGSVSGAWRRPGTVVAEPCARTPEPPRSAGAWQTASTLWPSGSRTKAP